MALFRKKPAKTKPAAGPSLTPVVTLILADVALRAGQSLVQNAIERGV